MTTTSTINEQFQSLVNGNTHLGAFGTPGTNQKIRSAFWEEFRIIYSENVSIEIAGNTIVLIATHSVSKKSTAYFGRLTAEAYTNILGAEFGLSNNPNIYPSISIQNGEVVISNGKNYYQKVENKKVTIL